jgi:hypothetical protein
LHPTEHISVATLGESRQALREVLDSKTFRQAPGHARLLQYLCTKALLADPQEVTEYTIGLDIFGKTSDFKEKKGSTVRVEVHRLRKRLTQYYGNEGTHSRVRIVIPVGQYFPEFQIWQTNGEGVPAEDEAAPADGMLEEEAAAAPGAGDLPPAAATAGAEAGGWPHEAPVVPDSRPRRIQFGNPAIAALLIIVLGGIAWFARRSGGAKETPAQNPVRSAGYRPAAAAGATVPVRIMSGYSGAPHTDPSGFVWSEDRYFDGGRAWQPQDQPPFLPRTNDAWLFRQYRTGEFSYHIPLPPGVYELHLYFVEHKPSLEPGGGENVGTFSVDINKERVIPYLDVDSNAMGPNIADELVWRDVKPAADGKLHIGFQGVNGVPFVSGVAVLPGTPRQQLPIRLVAQERPFRDRLGRLWQPDNYYSNGRSLLRDPSVAGSPDPGLFSGERYGHFSYALPVDVRGRYTLNLHFAEFYFGPQRPGGGGTGSRVFKVMCNGQLLLDDFDVFAAAGAHHALIKTFRHIAPTAQGKLNLTFEPVKNYAVISAIEVLEEP